MSSRFFPNEDLGTKPSLILSSNDSLNSKFQTPMSLNEEMLLSASSSNRCSAATSSSSLRSNRNQMKVNSQSPIFLPNSSIWKGTTNIVNHPSYSYSPFSMNSFQLPNPQVYYQNPGNVSNIATINIRTPFNSPYYLQSPINQPHVYQGYAVPNHYQQPQVISIPIQQVSLMSLNPYYSMESQTCHKCHKVSGPSTTSKEIVNDSTHEAIKVSKASELIIQIFEGIDDFMSRCESPLDYAITLKGSRQIQKLLTKEEDKAYSFYLFIYPYMNVLLTDVYGNYICKKVYSLLKQNQRMIAWSNISKDIKSYSEDQHANHSIQMLIAQSESDSEKEVIGNYLSPYYMYLAFHEHGINVLLAHLNMINLKDKDARITKFICDNILELCRGGTSILLCNALISKFAVEENDLRLHKHRILKLLKSRCHDLIRDEVSSNMIIKILEEWGLDFCKCLTSTIASNFMAYSFHHSSCTALLRYLELLNINVSEPLINLLEPKPY